MFEAPEDAVFLSHFFFDVDQGFDDHQGRQVLRIRPLEDLDKVLGGGLHSQCLKFFDDGFDVFSFMVMPPFEDISVIFGQGWCGQSEVV